MVKSLFWKRLHFPPFHSSRHDGDPIHSVRRDWARSRLFPENIWTKELARPRDILISLETTLVES